MNTTTRAIRTFCVEDQRAFVDALRVAIDLEPDIECIGVASSVPNALVDLEEDVPDVIVMDLDLPDVDGIEGTRRVKARWPNVRVVILTGMVDLDHIVRVAAAGADAFLPKDAPLATIFEALRDPRHEGMRLNEDMLAELRTRVAATATGRTTVALTDREREVLALLASGVDATGIARQLGITVHTARGYLRSVLEKLNAHSQLEAVVLAARAGLVRIEGPPQG
jgi:DNA-binding NarL/FixJ family response regulator